MEATQDIEGVKDKRSLTLVRMVRTDFNQQYTNAIGKRVQQELNSTLMCTEVPGHFKGKMSE